ncbi:MAG: CPBP family intramembrane metalloprotease [Paludibacteraceae bacterium]|nr:CPBP family intramembrane metalloprotease [Paludibacteraceae bacterium]
MKNRFVQILIWLGIMSVLTMLGMGLWLVFSGGSQTTESLKWLQLCQTLGTFLFPPIICALIWDENRKPFRWLKMDQKVSWKSIVWAIGIMVLAIPAINLLADLNSRVDLPESLDFIEQIFRRQEDAAAALTERFLKADNVWGLLINIGLLAFLPALSEELSFRGTLQQILGRNSGVESQKSKVERRVHIAIWVTAFVFSAIHLQFYGFVPRLLMGALFGYVFVWSESLWVPIVMHFTNNGLAVLFYYLFETSDAGKSYADTIGAGTTWWLGVISLLVVIALVITFPDRREYVRRTRTQ